MLLNHSPNMKGTTLKKVPSLTGTAPGNRAMGRPTGQRVSPQDLTFGEISSKYRLKHQAIA
jgi:hypothetical protein